MNVLAYKFHKQYFYLFLFRNVQKQHVPNKGF